MPKFEITSDCPTSGGDSERQDGRGIGNWTWTGTASNLSEAFDDAEAEFKSWYGTPLTGWTRIFRLDHRPNRSDHSFRIVAVHPFDTGNPPEIETRDYPQAYGGQPAQTVTVKRYPE